MANMGGGIMSRYEYIIAANWRDAREFMWHQGGGRCSFVYVDNLDRLRGLREPKVYVLSGAQFREDYDRLMLQVYVCESQVEYVRCNGDKGYPKW